MVHKNSLEAAGRFWGEIMNIEFSWGTGAMCVSAEAVIETMTLTKYRKWAKLFVTYGKSDDHVKFLQLLDKYIETAEIHKNHWNQRMFEFIQKAQGKIPTQLGVIFCEREASISQRYLHGAIKRLNRYIKMSEILKGLLS
jgi:hypothetical protein